MLLSTSEPLQVQHDAAHRLMRFQWRDPTNQALRPMLEYGRRLVEQHQPHLALVDFTDLPPVGLTDELWLSAYWFPRILKLPLRQVAVVSRPEHLHNQMVLEALLWLAGHLVRFQTQLFDDVPSALEWLLPAEPAARQRLLAEWPAAPVPAQAAADA